MNWTTMGSARTDFNSVREDGTLLIPRGRILGLVPTRGDPFLLEDHDGYSCQGLVRSVTQDRIYVTPLWQTWTPRAEAEPNRAFIGSIYHDLTGSPQLKLKVT